MSCIVSERGTRVAKPIFHVFCTRKIFLFPRNNCLSGCREIARNSRKSIGEKSDFSIFPSSTKFHMEPPKLSRKTQKMIQTSTHNIFLAHLSIRLPSPSWGLPLRCLWARIRNGQRAPKTAPRGDSTTPGSPWRPRVNL